MSRISQALLLLTASSLLHPVLALYNPLLDRRTSGANNLVLRRGRGGSGGGVYYKTCEESYGAGFAECYGSCFNAGAGEKCCDGNYSCPNGQYCGYGAYSYCCYDYKTPQECSSQYAIAQPPANWKPGDGNAPASITDPPIPTYPTSTYQPTYTPTSSPTFGGADPNTYTTPTTSSTYTTPTTSSTYTTPTTSRSLPTAGGAGVNTYTTPTDSFTLPSLTYPSYTSFTVPSLTPFSFTLPSASVPTNTVRAGGGSTAGAGSAAEGQLASGGKRAMGTPINKIVAIVAVVVGMGLGKL